MFISDVSVSRLNEIFDTPIAGGSDEFAPQGHDVVFDHVGFTYDAQGEATLEDVSFTAKEGEVTALVGPSGSGKSTCARLSARLWDHDQGTLTVGGVEVLDVDPETLMPSESFTSVSVLTKSSADGDALSTALFCMTLEEGLALVESLPETEAMWVLPDGQEKTSGGFDAYRTK